MPSSDVQYCLDSAIECGKLAPDTYHYFMELCPNTDAIFDEFEEKERPFDNFKNYWRDLTDSNLYLENMYINWRHENRVDARMASFMAMKHLPETFHELHGSVAGFLAQNKFTEINQRAIQYLDRKFDFTRVSKIMKRSLTRAAYDFMHADDLPEIENRIRIQTEERMYRAYHQLAMGDDTPWLDGDEYDGENNYIIKTKFTEKQHKKIFANLRKEREESKRKVIKRSIKFMNKLVGSETTRVFMGGNAIRFEGQYAIYELSKQSRAMESHGGFRALAVFDKEQPDLLLCRVCIGTPQVPLLDHVASIIMHIQAGEETEILRIGNASNIDPVSYEKEWLAPYLPKKRIRPINENEDMTEEEYLGRMIENHLYHNHGIPRDYQERKDAIMPQAAKFLYAEILQEFVPVISKANPRFLLPLTQQFLLT